MDVLGDEMTVEEWGMLDVLEGLEVGEICEAEGEATPLEELGRPVLEDWMDETVVV